MNLLPKMFALLALSLSCAGAEDRFTPEIADFVKRFKAGGALSDQSPRPSPAESLAAIKLADGLALDLAATEPMVRQPLNMHFDERGRLWVVQYLQYPFPAGVKVVKYDEYLRAVFDKVPPAPPHHFKGADRITILEDTDGDGIFDKAKDFLSDLNIARSVVTGRGGVWVLNPPYLLFYPDKNRDDIPDADPEVRLSGFGLEDTHSGANSLAWGPDGWLYGAHGSTCTADVSGVKFLGQAIWRYNPESRAFEVFAEGGGNTFSIEFDREGRVFSGTNYGNTRGLHYAQGGAYIKGWAKHGPLMNPYSFGWFEHMAHKGYEPRFPQTMVLYEGGALPKYEGQIIAGMALTSRVIASKLSRDGSTFRTDDTDTLALSSSRWFRPVDTKVGPDGAVYFADWSDSRLSHLDPRDTWDKESGRIWRLRATDGAKASPRFDFGKMSGDELIAALSHPNKWQRQTALRVLWDRRDASLVPKAKALVASERGQLALEGFWAVNACGGFDDAYAIETLHHANAMVRYWTIRLLGDRKRITAAQRDAMLRLALTEPEGEVRAQLASTLKRLPAPDALPVAREMLLRADDAGDKFIPLLLWWAVESKCADDRDAVLALFRESALWQAPIVRKTIVSRLGQRFAAARGDENLAICAQLLALAPTPADADELIRGMEAGLEGDPVKSVPASLRERVAEQWAAKAHTPVLVSFALRLGHAPAADAALALAADAKAAEADRRKFIALLAERRIDAAIPALLKLVRFEKSEPLRLDAINALQRFASPDIARELLDLHAGFPPKLRDAAQSALASRVEWARLFLAAVDDGSVKKEQIAPARLLAIQNLRDPACDALLKKHWGALTQTSAAKEQRIAQVRALLGAPGDARAGREVFRTLCAACHKLHSEGGAIGPDLTGYERDNLDFMLPAIVDPSLAIREEFTAFTIATRDGQTLTGFIEQQTPQSVTLKDLAGQRLVLARRDIEKLQASPTSLMPEGLLDALSEAQVRDLFSYLTSHEPLK